MKFFIQWYQLKMKKELKFYCEKYKLEDICNRNDRKEILLS